MISPELLRRYSFFGFLSEKEFNAIAMIAESLSLEKGETLFEADTPAEALYLVVAGCVEFAYVVNDHNQLGVHKEYFLGEHGPGEIVGISALIEPRVYTTNARVSSASCELVKIDSSALRALCEVDTNLACRLMSEAAKLALNRLHDTRGLLAAERA